MDHLPHLATLERNARMLADLATGMRIKDVIKKYNLRPRQIDRFDVNATPVAPRDAERHATVPVAALAELVQLRLPPSLVHSRYVHDRPQPVQPTLPEPEFDRVVTQDLWAWRVHSSRSDLQSSGRAMSWNAAQEAATVLWSERQAPAALLAGVKPHLSMRLPVRP